MRLVITQTTRVPDSHNVYPCHRSVNRTATNLKMLLTDPYSATVGFEPPESQRRGDECAPDQPVHFHSLRRLSNAATSSAAEDAENTE
jgi:hypothetical protein